MDANESKLDPLTAFCPPEATDPPRRRRPPSLARATWIGAKTGFRDGEMIQIGDKTLEVWSTPGHTAGQLALRMGNLLFSGDIIFRDGSVGVIDAHHGSNLVDFIASLKRILASDADYLLPSHGPIFRKDDALLKATIARLEGYTHMADFGTCAVDWPLMDAWVEELARGDLDFDGPSDPDRRLVGLTMRARPAAVATPGR
jgi:glyoxylase-like metal-dependent hydrolase (beta-lactamase superfamily II)